MVEAWRVLVEWTAWNPSWSISAYIWGEVTDCTVTSVKTYFLATPSTSCVIPAVFGSHSCRSVDQELQKVLEKQWVDWTKKGDACNSDAFTRLSTTSHLMWNRCHGYHQERKGTLELDILTLNWVPECGEGVHRHLCKGNPLQECIFLLSFSPVWPI